MKPDARGIFTVNIRIQSGVYSNYSVHQIGSEKIFGIDRGSKIEMAIMDLDRGPGP